jgi:hypothetical protein
MMSSGAVRKTDKVLGSFRELDKQLKALCHQTLERDLPPAWADRIALPTGGAAAELPGTLLVLNVVLLRSLSFPFACFCLPRLQKKSNMRWKK